MKTNLKSDEMLPDCWWNQAREIVWLGYSESLFLKAEAALRGWGNETGATVAGRLYEDGVRASMDYYSIASDKADEYISHFCVMICSSCSSLEPPAPKASLPFKWLIYSSALSEAIL